jgi:hypothetical protein
MSSPSKQKGTAGETSLLRALVPYIPTLHRTAASSKVDLESTGTGSVFRLLATRPDRGQWLISMPLEEFMEVWSSAYEEGRHFHLMPPVAIEAKRYARFAHHNIFESKFGAKV